MGQFRPSSLLPSTLTSTYTIDATEENIFTCNINGTSPTIKYQLVIMKNDNESTEVYNSGIVTLDSPLYPVNFDGTANQLEVAVPSTSGMINGNEYKWNISSYWSATDFYTSYDNVFKAYSKATISISNFQSTITQKSYLFEATCQQQEGIGIERFGWILRDADTKEEVINTIDSNNIYSSDVKLFYDGFLNGGKEEIKVKCWMLDGTSVETEYQEFNVLYDTVNFENAISIKQLKDSGIFVQWSNIYYIYGNPENEDYRFVLNYEKWIGRRYLELYSGNSIVYNQVTGKQMNFNTGCSHIIGFSTSNIQNNSIYKASGVDGSDSSYYIEVSYYNGIIYLDVNGTKYPVYNVNQELDKWIIMQISPDSIYLTTYTDDVSGLYLSESLYPSESLYLKETTYSSVNRNISINPNIILDGSFNEISISGYQKTLFTWVREEPLTQEEFYLFNETTYVPEWDSSTMLLCNYNSRFSAGNTIADSNIVGWIVYRKEENYPTLKYVCNSPASETFVVDYMAKNKVGISYYIFPSFEDSIGNASISGVFYPYWWDWYLIVCNKVSENVYTIKDYHKFDLDVESGMMTNNTSFNVLENFTKYAKIQNSKSNYWSGSISSLLGNCGNNYIDTIEEMEKIKSLSTDGLDKFLKDRKGNIWKVRLNSSVNEQINDKYVEQAVSVTLSWMEIGSSEYSVITQDPETSQDSVYQNIIR